MPRAFIEVPITPSIIKHTHQILRERTSIIEVYTLPVIMCLQICKYANSDHGKFKCKFEKYKLEVHYGKW